MGNTAGHKSTANTIPQDLPDRLVGEALAHLRCDFRPFGLDVWVHEAQEQLSVGFVIPGTRHDEAQIKSLAQVAGVAG